MFLSTKDWVLPIFFHPISTDLQPIFEIPINFLLWDQTNIKELMQETKWI